jgi:hypothetical protein
MGAEKGLWESSPIVELEADVASRLLSHIRRNTANPPHAMVHEQDSRP